MTDRRLHPATAHAAHISLRGQVGDAVLTDGIEAEIAPPLADLLASPDGPRERQLMHGEGFCIIDQTDTHAFGFARKDGYCGWIARRDLRHAKPKTHWVCTLASHLYPEPRVQAPPIMALPFGAQLNVIGQSGAIAQTDHGFVPMPHLQALGEGFPDPVGVAEMFLHSPYLWGGNSHMGIDCSGLVQAALLACGVAALGDSDLQQSLGVQMGAGDALRRGDLLFWRGHVAMVVDERRLIHANGHSMSVAYEGIAPCIARIAASGGGDVIQRRRVI